MRLQESACFNALLLLLYLHPDIQVDTANSKYLGRDNDK
jgi:hypothetical protein